MLKRLLRAQTESVTAGAIIVAAASLVSRSIGLLRDRVLAAEFGAGPELDMYYAAFRLPDVLYNLLIVGAISAGFIPVFSGLLAQPKKAWRLVSVMLNAFGITLVLASLVGAIFAGQLVSVIAPGFSPLQQATTAQLTRIMLLSPLFLGLSGIVGGVLQSYRRFLAFSFAPIFYNLGIIAGALFLVPLFGVIGLAWGVAFGALLHFVSQLPGLARLGYRHAWVLRGSEGGVGAIFRILIPRTLTIATGQFNLLVITTLASTLSAGSLTVFNLANNLQSLPLGLFGVSLAVAAFPALSQVADKPQKFIQVLSLGVRQMLFFMVPASALLIILRTHIVRAVLGSGRFSWEDTILTFQTLSAFALSLFAQALVLLLIRAFYARQDGRTPFIAAMLSVGLNIALAFALMPQAGVIGLALAFSLSSIFQAGFLWVQLRWQLGRLDGRQLFSSFYKIVIATTMLSLVAWAIRLGFGNWLGTQTLGAILAQSTAAAFVGGLVYVGMCAMLGSPELGPLVAAFKRRVLRRTPVPVEVVETEG